MADLASRKRRSRHDIIMEILRAAKDGTKKTNIMYKVRLSFPQLEKYLNAMKKADWITEKTDLWKTTEKGLHAIEVCDTCCRIIEEIT